MVSKNNPQRESWIDSLKGFSIICVVLGHILDRYLTSGQFPQYQIHIRNLYKFLYIFHMPIFFAISGMTFRLAYFTQESPEKIISKRKYNSQLLNLLFLYIEWSVLLGIFKILFSGFVNKSVFLSDILLIFAKPIGPYWYLYVLIFYYIIFRYYLENAAKPVFYKPAFIIIVMLFSLIGMLININKWFQVQNILFYAFFFFIGIELIANKDFYNFPLCVISLLISIFVIIQYWQGNKNIKIIPFVGTVSAFGISYALLFIFKKITIPFLRDFFMYLGRHCLEIFVIHVFLMAGFNIFFTKIGLSNIWLSTTLNLFLTIALCVILSEMTKKIHIYDLFFKPYSFICSKKRSRNYGDDLD